MKINMKESERLRIQKNEGESRKRWRATLIKRKKVLQLKFFIKQVRCENKSRKINQ